MDERETVRSSWQVQKATIRALTFRSLHIKIGDHVLGPVWLVVEPLIHIATLTIIFTFIRERADFQGVPFAAFFAAGILPYFIFQHTISRAIVCMRQNRVLFSYRQIKPVDVVLCLVIVELFVYFSLFCILIAVGEWFFGFQALPHRPLEVILIFILISLFSFGGALSVSVIGARWEDVGSIMIQMPMRLMYFISGIIIPMQELPVHLHKYLLWNPLLHAVEQIRVNTFENYVSPGTSISYLLICTIANLCIGLIFFEANRSKLLLLR